MQTLLFPDTRMLKTRLYPVLLLGKPLHLLRNADVDPAYPADQESSILESEFCQTHLPAPFGDKRERFLELIGLLRSDKTGSEHGSGPKEISRLLQHGAGQLADETFDAEVRRAQLILSLAEILDADEDSLKEELFLLDEEEMAAISSTPDQNDSASRELVRELNLLKTRVQAPRPENEVLRLSAWRQLLRHQELPPGLDLWLASTRAAAEQVFEYYRSDQGGSVIPVLKLAVPSHFPESVSYIVQHIKQFHQSTIEINHGLVADFEKITTTEKDLRNSPETLLPYQTDWADLWETALDQSFPPGSYGRNSVTFYLLPNRTLPELLIGSVAKNDRAGDKLHGLLAILNNDNHR